MNGTMTTKRNTGTTITLGRLVDAVGPLVVTPLGTALCRPSEKVLELLPVPTLPPLTKEDGEEVGDTGVRRDGGQ